MSRWMNKVLDKLSENLAHRKGLLPFMGITIIILNFLCQLIPLGWVSESNLLLHLGLVIAIFGLMLARAL